MVVESVGVSTQLPRHLGDGEGAARFHRSEDFLTYGALEQRELLLAPDPVDIVGVT